MSEATPYDVFLSNNSHDKPLVEQIAQRLVDEANLRPFLDKWHLIPGVEWQPELQDALRRSKTVAVFIGPAGNGPWHHEEIKVALNRAVREKQEFRVIPVLLPNGWSGDVTATPPPTPTASAGSAWPIRTSGWRTKTISRPRGSRSRLTTRRTNSTHGRSLC